MKEETLQILSQLLYQIAQSEKKIEQVRQQLCKQSSFTPFSMFSRLDTSQHDRLTCGNIKQFLNYMGISSSLEECQEFISIYDIDNDSCMSYPEFLKATLTTENSTLRIEASQRVPTNYLQSNTLKVEYEVEYTLAQLIQKEIQFNNEQKEIKIKLCTQDDFDSEIAFRFLDIDNKRQITFVDLCTFLERCRQEPTESDLDGLLRRLDFNNDGLVTYEDFKHKIDILPLNFDRSLLIQNKKQSNFEHQYSDEKQIKPQDQSSKKKAISPQKSSKQSLKYSPVKRTNSKSRLQQQQSAKKSSPQKYNGFTPEKYKQEIIQSPYQKLKQDQMNVKSILQQSPDIKLNKNDEILKQNQRYIDYEENEQSRNSNKKRQRAQTAIISKEQKRVSFSPEKQIYQDQILQTPPMSPYEIHRQKIEQDLTKSKLKTELLQKNSLYNSVCSQKSNKSARNQSLSYSEQKYDKFRTSIRGKMADIKQSNPSGIDFTKTYTFKNKNNSLQKKKNKKIFVEFTHISGQKYRDERERAEREKQLEKARKEFLYQEDIKENFEEKIHQKMGIPFSQSDKKQNRSAKKKDKNYLTYIAHFLDKMIQLEKQVYEAKKQLLQRQDFIVESLFKYIDKKQCGKISSIQFENFLNEINVQFSIDQVFLFIRKYDNDNDGKLELSNLIEAFYASNLKAQRPQQKQNNSQASLENIFSEKTIQRIQSVLEVLLFSEQEIEILRQEFQHQIKNDYHSAFQMIDLQKSGEVTHHEINYILQSNGIDNNPNDLKLLTRRFSQSNKINFKQFVMEIVPRAYQ